MLLRKQYQSEMHLALNPVRVKTTLTAYLTDKQQPTIPQRLDRGRLTGHAFVDRFECQREQPWWVREQPPSYTGIMTPTQTGVHIGVTARGGNDLFIVLGLFGVFAIALCGYALFVGTAVPWGIMVFVGILCIFHLIDVGLFEREVQEELTALYAVLRQAERIEQAHNDRAVIDAKEDGIQQPS